MALAVDNANCGSINVWPKARGWRVAAALLHKISQRMLEVVCAEAQQLTGAAGVRPASGGGGLAACDLQQRDGSCVL